MTLEQFINQRQAKVAVSEEEAGDFSSEAKVVYAPQCRKEVATTARAAFLLAIEEVEKLQFGTNGEGKKWVMLEDFYELLATLKQQAEGSSKSKAKQV